MKSIPVSSNTNPEHEDGAGQSLSEGGDRHEGENANNENVAAGHADRIDPRHRLSRLTLNKVLVSVKPTTYIEEAVTLMLTHDYSQLPVLDGQGLAKGLFSWKSLGVRQALRLKASAVRDAMETPCTLTDRHLIFDAVREVAAHDVVLVQDGSNRITGIVTAYDITVQFELLAGPFLHIGEIEEQIRYLVVKHFTKADLESAKDPTDENRKIDSASDLTFGEHLQLLQCKANWQKLGIPIDRVAFTRSLNDIRLIRNRIMHFNPAGVTDDDMKKLRTFASFLAMMRKFLKY